MNGFQVLSASRAQTSRADHGPVSSLSRVLVDCVTSSEGFCSVRG